MSMQLINLHPSHIYRFCIRSWLEHHSSCPTCRRSLVSKVDTVNQDADEARGFPRNDSSTEGSTATSVVDSLVASQRGSSTATPSQSAAMPTTSAPPATHPSSLSGHSTPNALTSNGGSSNHHAASGTSSNRSSVGHQLFAFNSEQQPWLSRLGFPKITVEVVDQAQDEDESRIPTRRSQQQTSQRSSSHSSNRPTTYQSQSSRRGGDEYSDDEDDEDLRRAIAESLAMSQQCQSQSTVSLLSSSSATTMAYESSLSASEHDLQRRLV
ncbi:MAG: hypothetical protein J3R72DRAFT_26098 [Linnemannia gamsii]|nr:MAG: hypothetical protein J3R72DRAFT_26098 [Linnemannia gamsii]